MNLQRTRPTGAPTNLNQKKIGTSVLYEWSEPPCGERNGNIIAYECVFKMDGQRYPRTDRTTNKKKFYFGVEPGGKYTFKVRAETTRGRGRYTKTYRL
ncbi:Receptor-type tyrosine-protein phosphatase F [Holothuria leucospilota]|uniref:Receptor-type tyrosine-protein phosphatase F n=1 Tax=Holothuria leucospilota TaxID=206669 RepID=A0A9Q1BN27_HOLLE|nr:Receptor-type tyrosine-protein phosphatase F [Holothuria leucospilota]